MMAKLKPGLQPGISLCMIVKNEERYLEGCLKSVQTLVNEMIIVDTGSTDKTIAIAEQFGAKIFHFPWVNDFSKARNESLKYATHEWVLYLDADERIEQKFHRGIRGLLTRKDFGAYLLNLKCYTDPNDNSKFDMALYRRLFRNYAGLKFQGKVHEQVTNWLEKMNVPAAHTDIVIEHLGYAVSEDIMAQKIERNLTLLKENLKEDPTDGYTWQQLGATYFAKHDFENAYAPLLKAVSLPSSSTATQGRAFNLLAAMAFHYKEFHKCCFYARQSLAVAPVQLHARYLKAEALFLLREYENTKVLYTELLERIQTTRAQKVDITNDVVIEPWRIYNRLAVIHEQSGDYETAFQYSQQSFQNFPNREDALYDLAILAANAKRFHESHRFSDQLKDQGHLAQYYVTKGNTFKLEKEYEPASQMFQSYISEFSMGTYLLQSLMALAEIYSEQGRTEELIESIESIVKKQNLEHDTEKLFRLKLYKQFKQNELFLFEAHRLCHQNPSDELFALFLHFYREQKNYSGALQIIEQAIEQGNSPLEFMKLKAEIYVDLHRVNDAIQLYKQIESIEPNSFGLQKHLDMLYEQHPQTSSGLVH